MQRSTEPQAVDGAAFSVSYYAPALKEESVDQVRAIPALDLAAVPLFVALRELWLMGQHARMAPLRGRWVTSFGSRLDFLRRWEQQHLAGI